MIRGLWVLWLAFGLAGGAVAQPGLDGVYVSVSDWSRWANVETGPRGEVRRIEYHSFQDQTILYESLTLFDSDTITQTSRIIIISQYRRSSGFTIVHRQHFERQGMRQTKAVLTIGALGHHRTDELVWFSNETVNQALDLHPLLEQSLIGTYQQAFDAQGGHWLICRDSSTYKIYYAPTGKPYAATNLLQQIGNDGLILVKPRGGQKRALRIRPAGFGEVELLEVGTGNCFTLVAPGCSPEAPTLPPRTSSISP